MNEFDKLKIGRTVEDVLRYNGSSVLLIGRQRERNLRTGQTFSRELLVSWFGRDTLKDVTAQWTLKATDGSVLGRGQQTVAPVAPGEVKKIAEISLDLPKLEQAVKATLIVELSGSGCKIDNRWDYWIFPSASSATPSNVTITDTLNTAALKALACGGRVVLFGHKPFPARSMGFQMGLSGRPEGNLATVIADHPLTERFPHDGYCDWQFAAMLEGATPVLFDKLGVTFDPIIEVVNSYKRPRKQAALFEWRVGAGRLLVCTLRLPKSNPAAAYLRHCLLDYAAGDQFQPGTTVHLEQLAKMAKLKLPKLEEQQKTDEAFDARGQLSLPKKQ